MRSYSLDSISTAVSLSTTAQIAPSHSSSLDNLHRPWEGGGTSGLQNNIKKESGKKYMPLETSSALSSGTVVCADEQRKSELTQSLPADGERHVALHPHSRSTGMGTGLDGFSDNFVIGTTGEEKSRESSDTVQTVSLCRLNLITIPSLLFRQLLKRKKVKSCLIVSLRPSTKLETEGKQLY